MSDEDDIEKTEMGQPEVQAEVDDADEGDELTDTIITGMPAFELPPDVAEAAVDAAVFDDDELGPEDTDETMIADAGDTDGGALEGEATGETEAAPDDAAEETGDSDGGDKPEVI